MDKAADHLDVITRHDHLLVSIGGAVGEVQVDRDVRSADEQLRAVVLHERCVATAFFLCQDLDRELNEWQYNIDPTEMTHVDRREELSDWLDRAGQGNDHATLDLLTLDATEERTHVVAGLALQCMLTAHIL